MLAPRATSAFVCIRCEVRLARPRFPAISNRPSRATFSSSARHNEDRDASGDLPTYQYSEPRSRRELSERPLGRLRKRKGKASIRETTARLGGGLKSLGDDAEILVLKEVGDAPPEEMPSTLIDTPEPVDIIASLMQEGSALGQDDVNSLLESLRPKTHAPADEPQYISQAAFLKLSNALVEGFTHPQLARYYISQKGPGLKVKRDKSAEAKDRVVVKKPIDRTEWYPGTTQNTKRLSKLRSAQEIKKKSKPLLVDQILRFAWNVIQLEEIEAPGEIEITLASWQLHLLTLSNPTHLDQIGTRRKAKIEIHSWDHRGDSDEVDTLPVLRITADKSTAEYAADDVEELLKNTERGVLFLEPWLPFMVEDTVHKDNPAKRFSPKMLSIIGKLSETYIRVAQVDTLLIRGLNKASIEQAKRSLLQMIPLEGPARHIDRRKLVAAQKKTLLLPTAFNKFLGYRYRSIELGRWSLPVPKTTSEHSAALQDASKSETAEKMDERFAVRIAKTLKDYQKKIHTSGGNPDLEKGERRSLQEYMIQNGVLAQFGQILVPLDPMSEATSSALTAPFCHVFPGLSNLLLNEAFSSEAQSTSPELEYEFLANPDPANPLKGDGKHPNLVMKFKYQRGSKPTLASIAFRTSESLYDAMLPERAVDVRFKVYQEIVYTNNTLMINDANVKSFIVAVVANIESGERLTAPSTLTIPLPRAAIPGYDAYDKGVRKLEYFFTGIRYRQSVQTVYQGHSVSYSTTRAGKLNEKGGTLSTYYDVNGDPKLLKSFVTTTLQIADLLTEASGNNKAMSKTVRPRDQMSARRLRRLEMAREEVDRQGLANDDGDHLSHNVIYKPLQRADSEVGKEQSFVNEDKDQNEHSSRNNGYESLPRNHMEIGEEQGDVSRAAAAFGIQESSMDQEQDDVKVPMHQIETGDIDDPYISSLLTEEQWTEPKVDELRLQKRPARSPQ